MSSFAVVSIAAGAGHVRAASAIVAAAKARGHQATAWEGLEFAPRPFRAVYGPGYLKLIQEHPWWWAGMYKATNRGIPGGLSRLRQALERRALGSLSARLRSEAPRAVVCTHFLPAHVLARALPGIPVWAVVTDIDLHAVWLQPGTTGICVATDELAWRARVRGYEGRIAVTGIPIMPGFSQRIIAGTPVLDSQRPVVALLSGGHGIGDLVHLAGRILDLPDRPQVIALAGRNQPLAKRLRALDRADLHVLGFLEHPETVLARADVAVGKPGGLTTAECLALGLPLVAVGAIPGQEEANADYLAARGAGIKAADQDAAIYHVGRLLYDRMAHRRMARKALSHAQPRAADAVLDAVLARSVG